MPTPYEGNRTAGDCAARTAGRSRSPRPASRGAWVVPGNVKWKRLPPRGLSVTLIVPPWPATQSLRAHVPELAAVGVGEFGHGFDNAAFLAGDLVLRVADGHSVLQEARFLGVVAAHVSVPVPMVRFVDEDAGILAYPLLPGRPLLGRPAAAGLARPLRRFLSELYAIDTATVDGLVPLDHAHPGDWLEDLDGPPGTVSRSCHFPGISVTAPRRRSADLLSRGTLVVT